MTRHRHVIIFGVASLLVLAVIVHRHRAKQAAQATTNAYAAQPFAAIPASFSYIRDNANPAQPTDPVALNNAGLALLSQLTDALVSRNGVPGSVRVAAGGSTHNTDMQGRGYRVDLNDFARGNQVSGFTAAQILAIARRQEPAYGGRRYSPHNIANNGQIQRDSHGRRYIRVKFADPAGILANSTETVYLP